MKSSLLELDNPCEIPVKSPQKCPQKSYFLPFYFAEKGRKAE